MSLAIYTDCVIAVLLVDGWHDVTGNSFDIDAYEFLDGHPDDPKNKNESYNPYVLLGGAEENLIPGRGARWYEGKIEVCCPLTSVLAVRSVMKKKKQRCVKPSQLTHSQPLTDTQNNP